MVLLIFGALISPVDQHSYKALASALLCVGKDGVTKTIRQVGPAGTEDADGFPEEAGRSEGLEVGFHSERRVLDPRPHRSSCRAWPPTEMRRRKGDVGVANYNVRMSDCVEKRLKEELDAMLERLLFCGDDRNLRRVYIRG